MKHLKGYKEEQKPKRREIPNWAKPIDISKLKLINPYELSYFQDMENKSYYYDSLRGGKHTYDDKWEWLLLFNTSEGVYDSPSGYVIFKNDVPIYVVGIYEPKGVVASKSNVASQVGGLITIFGYKTVINLWLDYDEYDATRVDAL